MHKLKFLAILVLTLTFSILSCSALTYNPTPNNLTPVPLPRACSEVPQLAYSDKFEFNPDYKRRDEIIALDVEWGKNDIGGIMWFEKLSLSPIAHLYEEKFLDPADRQNLAPTAGEILTFMCKYPFVLASGYVVSPEREDYRVTINAIEIPRSFVSSEVKTEFEQLCQEADELDTSGDLYCWWD